MFWVIATALTALVLLPVLAAILRKDDPGASGADLAIYRDQLAEVDRDLARGLLNPDEAERTRLEVQRRLLDADRRGSDAPHATPTGIRYALMAVATLIVGAGTFIIYDDRGEPGYRDLPLATRLALADEARSDRPAQDEAEISAEPFLPAPSALDPDFAELMSQLRRALEQRPEDIQGYRLLARNEAGAGNLRAARLAQARLVDLLGDDATVEDLIVLAELQVRAAGGIVTNDAEATLDRALSMAPDDGAALYYKGLSLAQIGRADQAFEIWRALLERGPESAAWIPPIRAQIADLAARAGVRYDVPAAAPGPSADDVEAAADMTPGERAEMIGAMVQGLSDRLANEGGTSSEWARLIVALAALGRSERATAILDEAQSVFAGNADDLAIIDTAATEAGLGR